MIHKPIVLALLCAALGCSAPPAASVALPPPPACPTTPPELAPPLGNVVAFALDVDRNGVQRYHCLPAGWSASIPAAALFTVGPAPRQAIAHFAGPEWMASDGSSIVATKRAAVVVDTGAIPWLDLEVTSHSETPGILTSVTWVQRLTTRDGLPPPADTCDAAHVGDEQDVAYSARYWFYRAADPAAPGVRCGS